MSDILPHVVYDTATGRILNLVLSTEHSPLDQRPGTAILDVSTDFSPSDVDAFMVAAGVLAPRVYTLAELQRAKLGTAISYFSALTAPPNGFTFSGILYQIDTASRSNIASMSVMALASIADPTGNPWQEGFYWLATDNSHVAMDAATMLAFGHAVETYVSTCILRLRAIKDALAAATDQAALDAIDVTAGYPSASG